VTAKVSFKEPASLPIPQAPPPTFLFLLIFNCQITDDHNAVTKSMPQTLSPELKPATANPLDFFRTKVAVASSAAALVQ